MTERITDEEGFAAIRKSSRDGEEWLDFVSLRATEEAALAASESANSGVQHQWRTDNPVVAMAQVAIKVVKRWPRRSTR